MSHPVLFLSVYKQSKQKGLRVCFLFSALKIKTTFSYHYLVNLLRFLSLPSYCAENFYKTKWTRQDVGNFYKYAVMSNIISCYLTIDRVKLILFNCFTSLLTKPRKPINLKDIKVNYFIFITFRRWHYIISQLKQVSHAP